MSEFETLETMAEIAVALTGFTGVVSVFGSRSNGNWAGPDRLFLLSLLNWSVLAVILGVLPSVLLTSNIELARLWVIVSIVFMCCHWITHWWFVVEATKIGLSRFRRFEQIVIAVGVPVGTALCIAQVLVVSGYWASQSELIYHLGILWYLLTSALAFSFILFPRAQYASESQ